MLVHGNKHIKVDFNKGSRSCIENLYGVLVNSDIAV